jgi:hypothetical protein
MEGRNCVPTTPTDKQQLEDGHSSRCVTTSDMATQRTLTKINFVRICYRPV